MPNPTDHIQQGETLPQRIQIARMLKEPNFNPNFLVISSTILAFQRRKQHPTCSAGCSFIASDAEFKNTFRKWNQIRSKSSRLFPFPLLASQRQSPVLKPFPRFLIDCLLDWVQSQKESDLNQPTQTIKEILQQSSPKILRCTRKEEPIQNLLRERLLDSSSISELAPKSKVNSQLAEAESEPKSEFETKSQKHPQTNRSSPFSLL